METLYPQTKKGPGGQGWKLELKSPGASSTSSSARKGKKEGRKDVIVKIKLTVLEAATAN